MPVPPVPPPSPFNGHRIKPDWRQVYLDEVGKYELALSRFSDAVFTLWSFAAHVVLYVLLWIIIAWPQFLNAISVEAVFVSLCVGINTKLQLKGDRVAQRQRDYIQDEMERKLKAIHDAVVEQPDA